MKEHAINWDAVPDVITKDQLYRICHISKSTALYLLDCRSVHIDFKVSHEPGEIRVGRQLAQERIVHQSAFQSSGLLVSLGIAHCRPNLTAPLSLPSEQRTWIRRSEIPHRSAAS